VKGRVLAGRRSLGVERAAAALRPRRHLVAVVGGGPGRDRVLGHGVVERPAGDARRTADRRGRVLAGGRGGGRSSDGVVDTGAAGDDRCHGGAAVTGRELRRAVGLAAGRRTVPDVGQTPTKHLLDTRTHNLHPIDGCIVWNAHNTVFGSKRSAVCAIV